MAPRYNIPHRCLERSPERGSRAADRRLLPDRGDLRHGAWHLPVCRRSARRPDRVNPLRPSGILRRQRVTGDDGHAAFLLGVDTSVYGLPGFLGVCGDVRLDLCGTVSVVATGNQHVLLQHLERTGIDHTS